MTQQRLLTRSGLPDSMCPPYAIEWVHSLRRKWTGPGVEISGIFLPPGTPVFVWWEAAQGIRAFGVG